MADIIKQKFEETLEKIGVINAPRSLIKDGKFESEFTANGTKYIAMPPDKVFNIDRQVAYHNIETAFALNQTPTNIKERFTKMWDTVIRLMGAKGDDWQSNMDTMLRDCMNNMDSFKGELTSRYPAAYYICTLFIIREGEDLSHWDFETADTKIDDWVKENIASVDFFGLALATSKELQEILDTN
tara:strand:- start:283 stop:837 length:555 start_codon:yes stop_codon:yes gene_type:complete